MLSESQAAGVLFVRWIPGEFNAACFFMNSTLTDNTRNNLVESIFSKPASPIGDIEKAWVHLHVGASKYLPHYNNSRRKWLLKLYICHSNWSSMLINLWGLYKYESKNTCSLTTVRANIGQMYEQTRMDERTNRQTDEWMNRRTDGESMRIICLNDVNRGVMEH